MGWVERTACRLYTRGNGEAAMAYLASFIPLGDADAAARLGSTAYKALKLAAQFMGHGRPDLVCWRSPDSVHLLACNAAPAKCTAIASWTFCSARHGCNPEPKTYDSSTPRSTL